MKTLTGAQISAITQQYGSEPIIVAGIKWVSDGNEILYAGKTLSGIEGKIISVSDIDAILNILNGTSTTNASLTLDDTDNFINTLMQTNDIHKAKVTLYLYYAGVDKIPLFTGNIETPIVWSEGERTISFDIVSKVEDIEVGFSPESGQFDFVSPELIGEPWPLVFGSVVNMPAVKINEAPTGSLRTPFGLVDQSLIIKETMLTNRETQLLGLLTGAAILRGVSENIALPAVELRDKYLQTLAELDELFKDLLKGQEKILEYNKLLDDDDISDVRKDRIKQQKDLTLKDLDKITAKIQEYGNFRNLAQYWLTLLDAESQSVDELTNKMNEILKQLFETQQALIQVKLAIIQQKKYVKNKIIIVNGRKFPQGETVNLSINDLIFSGIFDGDEFTIQAGPLAQYTGVNVSPVSGTIDRFTADNDINLSGLYGLTPNGQIVQINAAEDGQYSITLEQVTADETSVPDTSNMYQTTPQLSAYSAAILSRLTVISQQDIQNVIMFDQYVNSEASRSFPSVVLPSEKYKLTNQSMSTFTEVSPTILPNWLNQTDLETGLNNSTFWYADVGSNVTIAGNPVKYVISITGATIKSVTANKATDGIMQLTEVPTRYYNVTTRVSGPYTLVFLEFERSLSTYTKENWDDTIYVSLESDVGPNIVDVVDWIIDTYTDDSFDSSGVGSALDNFSLNCVVKDRRNLVSILQEICWQSRSQITYKQGTWYMTYLSALPTPTVTITEDEIEANTLRVTLTPTDDLVTKFIGTWYSDLSVDKPNKVILRHNINKYGTKEKTFDFWMYNDQEQVERSATFWLIRYSNVWKILEFTTALDTLSLETGDPVEIDLDIFDEPVTGIIDSVKYNLESYRCHYSVWLPIKAGTNSVYDLAWPGTVDSSVEFPTIDEVAAGNAGSGVPQSANINQPTSTLPTLAFNVRPRDYGTRFPSDSVYGGYTNPLPTLPALPGSGIPNVQNPNVPNGAINLNPNNPFLPLRQPTNQNVWGGIVTKVVDNKTVEVQLNTGEIGQCLLAEPLEGDWDTVKEFEPVVVTKNIQGSFFAARMGSYKQRIRSGRIKLIAGDILTVECVDNGKKYQVDVRKPAMFMQNLIKNEDNDKVIKPFGGKWKYEIIDDNTLLCTVDSENPEMYFEATLSQEYQIGELINFAYDPLSITTGPVDSADPIQSTFVDLNTAGRYWRPVPIQYGTLNEDYTRLGLEVSTAKFLVTLKVSGRQVQLKARILDVPQGAKFLAGEMSGPLTLDPDTFDYNQLTRRTNAYRIKAKLLGTIKDGQDGLGIIVDTAYGNRPNAFGLVKLKNTIGHELKQNSVCIAERRDDNDYDIIIGQCDTEDNNLGGLD